MAQLTHVDPVPENVGQRPIAQGDPPDDPTGGQSAAPCHDPALAQVALKRRQRVEREVALEDQPHRLRLPSGTMPPTQMPRRFEAASFHRSERRSARRNGLGRLRVAVFGSRTIARGRSGIGQHELAPDEPPLSSRSGSHSARMVSGLSSRRHTCAVEGTWISVGIE